MNDFSRVGATSAKQILKLAKIDGEKKPSEVDITETARLHKSMQMVKLIAPPTNCLSPMTENLIESGLRKEIDAEYYVSVTRPPSVYRGNPFQVEVGLAYGGNLNPKTTAHIYRFANKVPLLYHQRGCCLNLAVEEVDWKRYGLSQSGGLPTGPLVVLIHFASVWVPFTSEGKEAIANYPEIIKEVKLALQEAGRKLSTFIRKKRKAKQKQMRRKLFERYIPEVAEALEKLTGEKKEKIIEDLEKNMKNNKKLNIDDVSEDEKKTSTEEGKKEIGEPSEEKETETKAKKKKSKKSE